MTETVSRLYRSTPFLVAVTLLIYALAISLQIQSHGGEPTSTVGFGCLPSDICFSHLNREALPQRSLIYRSGGYDGQFYYYIASEIYSPVSVQVDSVPFRYARIGYPALAGWGALVSPEFLLFTMLLFPVILHISVVGWIRSFSQGRGWSLHGVWLFALNPFSLYCSTLLLSDGLALSLTAVALLFYRTGRCCDDASRGQIYFLSSTLALTLALLTKETLVVYPGAFLVAALLVERKVMDRIREAIFWGIPLLVMVLWWDRVGFSTSVASERGGFPFEGFFLYLKNNGISLSGRSFLIPLTIALPLWALLLVGIWKIPGWIQNRGVSPGSEWSLRSGGVLLAMTAILSMATDHEYWANFANIVRFFTPMALIPLLLIFQRSHQEMGGTPGRDRASLTVFSQLESFARGPILVWLLLYLTLFSGAILGDLARSSDASRYEIWIDGVLSEKATQNRAP